MKNIIPLIALLLVSLALIAEEDLITKLGSDNDGLISIEEAAEDASLTAMFAELDTNKNGYLSPGEIESS
jgi:hypothetical protein